MPFYTGYGIKWEALISHKVIPHLFTCQNYRTPNNITKGKSKLISIETDKISQQPENCENRNDPDLVQAFLKKGWVESDFKAPNLPLSVRLKGSGCHYNSIYNNTGTK